MRHSFALENEVLGHVVLKAACMSLVLALQPYVIVEIGHVP